MNECKIALGIKCSMECNLEGMKKKNSFVLLLLLYDDDLLGFWSSKQANNRAKFYLKGEKIINQSINQYISFVSPSIRKYKILHRVNA